MNEIFDLLKEYTCATEDLCSNFDHEINKSLLEKMSNEKIVAGYPAWNFNGIVWFADGKYNCAVMQYRSLSEVISAESFEEVKKKVCDKYGYD